jgi:hypothetical protein
VAAFLYSEGESATFLVERDEDEDDGGDGDDSRSRRANYKCDFNSVGLDASRVKPSLP